MSPKLVDSKLLKENEIKEILYEGKLYDVSDWIYRHPGGKIIEFYTKPGEDATLAIQQFHNRAMPKTLGILKSLKSRQNKDVVGKKEKYYMDLTKEVQFPHKEFEAEKLFESDSVHVFWRFFEIPLLCLVLLYLLYLANGLGTFLGTIFASSILITRIGGLIHEAGHLSLTCKPKVDHFILKAALGLFNGMSGSWWMNHHNQHHAMPQRLSRDSNLDTLPLIAFNKLVSEKPQKDGNSFFVKHQAKLFILLDTLLVSLYWKLYVHPRYAWENKAYFDLVCMTIHYCFIISLFSPLLYILSMWISSIILIGNISLNHTYLPVTQEPLHWFEYSLYHTCDIEGGWFVDWWMGYLNYQVEHHLFPTMPQFKNKKIKERVKKMAQKFDIPYLSYGFWEAVQMAFNNLENVSKELKKEAEN